MQFSIKQRTCYVLNLLSYNACLDTRLTANALCLNIVQPESVLAHRRTGCRRWKVIVFIRPILEDGVDLLCWLILLPLMDIFLSTIAQLHAVLWYICAILWSC